MTESPKAVLELDPSKITKIIDTAVVVSSELVSFHLSALANADLSKASDSLALFRFRGPALSAEQRRLMHENWILAKGFQELLRAGRHGLELTHVIATLVSQGGHRTKSDTTVADFLRPYEEKAAKLTFPDLLAQVNKLLSTELEFSDSYQSLQSARNCLEHRAGIVSKVETRDRDSFDLSIPRMKLYYVSGDGAEVTIEPGVVVEPRDDRTSVQVFGKIEVRKKALSLAQRVMFTLIDFNEIAFACHHLGVQLVSKLPKPKSAV